jgi:pyrroline-5-carboxylate reductase
MKINNFLNEVSEPVIGIVGFGHLGRSLAVPLVRNGLHKDRLLISHKGSEDTRKKAVELGLGSCLTDTASLMADADITIIAARPQDVLALPSGALKPGALVISCMAGLPLDLLKTIFHGDILRMMCSGPDTILGGRGIATMFPADARANDVLRMMGLRVFDSSFEEELDSFTVGICIPAILLNIHADERDVQAAVDGMRKRYPVYRKLWGWIREIVPADSALSSNDRRANLDNVSTKGGITQAMTEALMGGGSFSSALQRGMCRGREITDAIRKDLAAALKRAV